MKAIAIISPRGMDLPFCDSTSSVEPFHIQYSPHKMWYCSQKLRCLYWNLWSKCTESIWTSNLSSKIFLIKFCIWQNHLYPQRTTNVLLSPPVLTGIHIKKPQINFSHQKAPKNLQNRLVLSLNTSYPCSSVIHWVQKVESITYTDTGSGVRTASLLDTLSGLSLG